MLDLGAIEARAEYKLAHLEGQGISLRDITWTLQDVLNLLAELRAAREVVEAALDVASPYRKAVVRASLAEMKYTPMVNLVTALDALEKP